MASNFVPMLSSSPPPLDDCPDDDDEEFGNFASANIQFDSSFDSPVASEKHKPYKSGDNGVNDVTLNSDFNTFCSFNSSNSPPIQNHVNDVSQKNQIINAHKTNCENDCKEKCISSNSLNKESNFEEKSEICPDSRTVLNHVSCDDFIAPDSPSSSLYSSDDKPDLNFCSTDKDINQEKDDFDTVSNELDNINDDSSESISVSTPVEKTECFSNEITSNNQTFDVPPQGLFNSNNLIDHDEKTRSHISSDYVTENVSASENLEFPVNFEVVDDEFDDFDDFQQAVPEQTHTVEIENNVCEHSTQSKTGDDEFHADFNHFSKSQNCDCGDNEEFDDFQSFDKSNNGTSVKQMLGNCDESDYETFQTFKKCESASIESEDFDDFQGCSGDGVSNTQDFANFEDANSLDEKHSESPEFADFESASFSSVSEEVPPSFACATSTSTPDKSVDKITTVMNAIFPLRSESSETFCDQPSEILEQSNKSHRLWEKLHEVEQAPGLRFQWGVSHSFQQLLRSVNVDYHSILRTSSVPIFASSLSLLEPVKGQTNTVNAESEDRNQSSKVNDPIPPVEFDWTSSGLVNPLDSGLAASALMDLSFLAATDTATSSSNTDYSFENELLKPSPAPACSENKTLILEELLSKNVCSLPNSKTVHRPSSISQEANSVLDQLPDLSFMRAKVLMFPISSKT